MYKPTSWKDALRYICTTGEPCDIFSLGRFPSLMAEEIVGIQPMTAPSPYMFDMTIKKEE